MVHRANRVRGRQPPHRRDCLWRLHLLPLPDRDLRKVDFLTLRQISSLAYGVNFQCRQRGNLCCCLTIEPDYPYGNAGVHHASGHGRNLGAHRRKAAKAVCIASIGWSAASRRVTPRGGGLIGGAGRAGRRV